MTIPMAIVGAVVALLLALVAGVFNAGRIIGNVSTQLEALSTALEQLKEELQQIRRESEDVRANVTVLQRERDITRNERRNKVTGSF